MAVRACAAALALAGAASLSPGMAERRSGTPILPRIDGFAPRAGLSTEPPPLGTVYTNLTKNQQITDTLIVSPGSSMFSIYNYYSIVATGPFKVYVFPQYPGDADLFVSDYTNPTPQFLASNWSCITDYTEVVAIQAANCPGPSTCQFYASTTPYYAVNTTYQIMFTDLTTPVALTPGQMQYGFVYTNDYNYYTISWTPKSLSDTFTLSLSTLNGDPDVFVLINPPAGTYPSTTSYQYAALGTSGVELITINTSPIQQPTNCIFGVACNIVVAVHGAIGGSYNIVGGGTGVSTSLASGMPLQAYVSEGSSALYAFTVQYPSNVSIVVTSLSGDPELFVSTVNPFPNSNNYTWASATTNVDERIWIPQSDPNYPAVLPFTLYIAVNGYNGNATFVITATMMNTSATPTTLLDGVPQAGRAPAHDFAYYAFSLSSAQGGQQGLDVVATPRDGDVDIYVSNLTYTDSNGQTQVVLPRRVCAYVSSSSGNCLVWSVDNTTYTWRSTNAYSPDVVSIPLSQVYAGERFIIGVFATSPSVAAGPSHFDVVATTTGTVTTMQNSVALPGVVSGGLYKYYRFDIANPSDVIIQANLQAGGVDLFASESQPVNNATNTWNNTAKGGILRDRYLYLPWANFSSVCQARVLSGTTCPLFIAVQGWTSTPSFVQATYTITAEYSGNPNDPLPLVNGFPVYTYVPANGYAYLTTRVYVPGGNQTLYISVTNYGGSSSLFVNIGANKTFATLATSGSADYVSSDLGGYERVIISPTRLHGEQAQKEEEGHGDAAAAPETRQLELTRYEPTAEEKAAAVYPTVDVYDGGKLVRTLDPAVDGAFLSKYRPDVMHAYTSAMDAATGRTDGATLGDPAYCNNCPLFVSVYGRTSSYVSVQYTAGPVTEALRDDVQVFRSSPPVDQGASFFTFNQLSSEHGFLLQIQQITGEVEAYISVQDPSYPATMPGPQRYQYKMQVWAGQNGIRVSPNDTSFCVSWDGFATGAPCTYAITVVSRQASPSYFTIIATVESTNPIVNLAEDVPETGRVMEGSYSFYSFTASTPGTPPPLVSVYSQALSGRVEVYVTNQFIPGVSSASLLPTAGNPRLSCLWVASNWTSWVSIPTYDPCYNPQMNVYTIGVLGATYIPGLVSRFMLTASSGSQVRLLPLATQLSNRLVPDNVNVTYVFDIEDATRDTIITTTPTYGSVAIAVRKHYRSDIDPTDPNAVLSLPGCFQTHLGAQILCSGYTWLASSAQGAPSIYIPAANPCSPPTAMGVPSPIVNASCNATTDYTPGRYFVTVYGINKGLNEYSISAQVAGGPPNDVVTIAEGQPQLGFTTNYTICASRLNNTAGCVGDSSTFLNVQGSFFTFRTPAQTIPGLQLDQQMFLERLCNGRSTGDCGYSLAVYVRACVSGYCNPIDMYPHPSTVYDYSYSMRMRDSTGGLTVPYGACYTPGALKTADCIYFIGVYPQCQDPWAPGANVTVGSGCAAQEIFRMTYTGNTGTTRISQDCFSGPFNETCKTDPDTAGMGDVLRYEAFLPQDPGVMSTVTVTSCVGGATMYLCAPFGNAGGAGGSGQGTKCNPWSYPGPQNGGNFDISASTVPSGSASYASYGASLEFFGVQTTLPPGVPVGLPNATYYVSISTGTNAPLLSPMGDAPPAFTRSADGTMVNVRWNPPVLVNNPNNPLPETPPNVGYTAYLFAASPGSGTAATLPQVTFGLSAYNMRDPCGMASAHASCPGGCAKMSFASGGDTAAQFTGLDPGQSFVLAIAAKCNAYWCMPTYNGIPLQAQSFAYNPISVPTPGPGQTSQSASPAPGPGPGGPTGGGGSNTGAIVGGIVGTLAILGAAAGGFVLYRRRGGFGGGRSSAPSFHGGSSENVVSNLLSSIGLSSGGGQPVAYSSSALDSSGMGGGAVAGEADMGAAYTEFNDGGA